MSSDQQGDGAGPSSSGGSKGDQTDAVQNSLNRLLISGNGTNMCRACLFFWLDLLLAMH